MRDGHSLRGFVAGVLVGVLVGATGIAGAAVGYRMWQKLPNPYKTGYMNGFVDVANLARNLDPGGYIDTRFPQVPKAQPTDWRDMVDELYKDPKNQDYTMLSILQVASRRLEDKFGKGLTPTERIQEKLKFQLGEIRARQLAAGEKPNVPPTEDVPSTPKVVANGDGAVELGAIPVGDDSAQPHKRKRCPCAVKAAAEAKPEAEPHPGAAAKAGDASKTGDDAKTADAAKAGAAAKGGAAAKPVSPKEAAGGPAKVTVPAAAADKSDPAKKAAHAPDAKPAGDATTKPAEPN